MHRCLYLPEILSRICLHLSDADLLSTALTCRDYKLIAIRALWRHLRDLSPVIKCLPRDTWKEKKVEKEIRYKLVRDLQPKDWGSILPYLPMVHVIDKYGSGHTKIAKKLLRSIVTSFPGKAFFPNIRHIDMNAGGDAMSLIQSSLGPQLQNLTTGWSSDITEKAGVSFILSIPSLCPNIKQLHLPCWNFHHPALSEAISQLENLEGLSVPYLTESALIHISQLPSLRDLAIDRRDTPQLTSFPAVSGPAFPALRTLRIGEESFSFHIDILATISSSQLQKYEGNFEYTPTAKECKDILVRLTALPQNLQEITIGYNDDPEDKDDPIYIITPETLRPLLSLKHLILLDLSGFLFDLDDEFVQEFAKACPSLATAYFGTLSYPSGRHSRNTLMSYVHLVRHCPKLSTIGLIVDTSHATRNLRVNPAGGIPNRIHGRFCFFVGDSFIVDPVAVASFLSSLVDPKCQDPSKIDIETDDDCSSDVKEKWKTVRELLPAFIAVRAQEVLGSESQADG